MSRADDDDRKREAVKSVAADLVKTSRGQLSQSDAERRVNTARERGDRKRENGNR